MKKIVYSALIFLGVLACTPDKDYEGAYRKYVGINTTALGDAQSVNVWAVPEDDGTPFVITLAYGEPDPSGSKSAVSVSYEITGGAYGTEYTLEGGDGAKGTITIPAGEQGKSMATLKITPKADLVNEPDLPLTFTVTSAPEGVSLGYPYVKSVELIVQNDDCTYDAKSWATVLEATEVYAAPDDPYGPYDVTLTQDDVDPNKFVMDDFWDSGITAYVIFDPNSHKITFPAQDDGDGGTISGTGSYLQCNNSFKITTHYVTKTNKVYDWNYVFTLKEE